MHSIALSRKILFRLASALALLAVALALFPPALTLRPAYAATIQANDDDFSSTPINGFVGGSTPTVYDNDRLNGGFFLATDVVPSISNNGGLTGVGINSADGTLTIPAGTAAKTYYVKYKICVAVELTTCDIATAKVVVTAAPIDAVDDDFTGTPFDTFVGGTTASVFTNDTLNSAAFAPAAVTASITNNGGLKNVTINADGTMDVPTGAAVKTYNVTYKICEVLNPKNCDTAKASIKITIDLSCVGTVYSDNNQNGSKGSNEPGIKNVTMILKDSSGTTTLDTTVTNSNGQYTFTGLSPSTTYTIELDESTLPTGELLIFVNPSSNTTTVTTGGSETCAHADFGLVVLDPTITKDESRDSAVPGDTVVYTLEVNNPLPTDLTNVTVTDPLDDNLDYVSATTTKGSRSYSSSANEVTFNIGTLSAGQTVTMKVTVRVASNVSRPSTLSNQATFDSTEAGSRNSNVVKLDIPEVPATSTPAPTAIPAPTATQSSAFPSQLPATGDQPSPPAGLLYAGIGLMSVSLVLMVGLLALYLRRKARSTPSQGTPPYINRWVWLGLGLVLLAVVGFVILQSTANQVAEVSPSSPVSTLTPLSSSLDTTDQPLGINLAGLLPTEQKSEPTATSSPIPRPQAFAKPSLPATHLIVPVLNLETDLVEAPVINGTWDVSQFNLEVAHLDMTAYPGTKGNAVIAGHVHTKEGIGPFYKLTTMHTGDIIIADGPGISYVYRVEWVKEVGASEIDVALPTNDSVLTLVTCTNWNSLTRQYDSRLAVRATLVDTVQGEAHDNGLLSSLTAQ